MTDRTVAEMVRLADEILAAEGENDEFTQMARDVRMLAAEVEYQRGAIDYLRRLWRDLVPQYQAEDDPQHFVLQIDNYIAGLRAAEARAERLAIDLRLAEELHCQAEDRWQLEHDHAERLAAAMHCATIEFPDFLEWIADRLVFVHGERRIVDYVVTLRERAAAIRAALVECETAQKTIGPALGCVAGDGSPADAPVQHDYSLGRGNDRRVPDERKDGDG